MNQQKFLEVLKKDIKSGRRTALIFGSILIGIVLFILASLTQGITIREQDVAAAVIGLIFLIAFLVLGLVLLRNGLRSADDSIFYQAFRTNPSQIIWIYKKIENRQGLYSFDLVLCHVNKKRHQIHCKNSATLDVFHTVAVSFNPQAIAAYRLEWESFYKNSPTQFISLVHQEFANLKNIPLSNSINNI